MEKDCEQLLSLLEDVYETVHDPAHWNTVLTKLSSYVDKGKAALTARDNETGLVDGLDLAITKIVGIDNKLVGSYMNEVCFYDPWIPIEVDHDYTKNPVCLFSNCLEKEKLLKTDFYKHWLQKLNITDGIAVQVFKTEHFRVVLNVFFDDDSSSVQSLCKDIVKLAPHLNRAVSLWMTLNSEYLTPSQQLRTNSLIKTYGVTKRELQIVSSYFRWGNADRAATECNIQPDTVHKNVKIVKEKMGCKTPHSLWLKLLAYTDQN